jgi:hypothetical protein
MKAILEFTLPEEAEEHRHAVNGTRYLSAIEQIRSGFRLRAKYTEDGATSWAEAYQLFWDELNKSGVELD